MPAGLIITASKSSSKKKKKKKNLSMDEDQWYEVKMLEKVTFTAWQRTWHFGAGLLLASPTTFTSGTEILVMMPLVIPPILCGCSEEY